MYSQQKQYVVGLMVLVDGVATLAAALSAVYLEWDLLGRAARIDLVALLVLVVAAMVSSHFALEYLGMYEIRPRMRLGRVFLRLGAAVLASGGIIAAVGYVVGYRVTLHFLLAFCGLQFAGQAAVRAVLSGVLSRHLDSASSSRNVLFVGPPEKISFISQAFLSQLSWGHHIAGYLGPQGGEGTVNDVECLGPIQDLEKKVIDRNIDEVVFALPSNRDMNLDLGPLITVCEDIGVDYRIVPSLFDIKSAKHLKADSVGEIPTLYVSAANINASGKVFKHMFDTVCGLVGLCALALMFPFVATAILADNWGPVFFRQKRVGLNGRVFTMYKFRTMVRDAEERKLELLHLNECSGNIFKIKDDPRITRVGRFLRKYSIDEFPQFINVVKGDMSMVGTRPPTVDEVAAYKRWQRRRMSIRPGITGLWQISGRNQISDFDEIVRLDLEYIDKWSPGFDLIIILKTIGVMFNRRGAC